MAGALQSAPLYIAAEISLGHAHLGLGMADGGTCTLHLMLAHHDAVRRLPGFTARAPQIFPTQRNNASSSASRG